MVPIVEPEVLMDGSHHIDKCYQVTSDVLNGAVMNWKFIKLIQELWKPNMVILALSVNKSNPLEIAKKTLDCLKKCSSEVRALLFCQGDIRNGQVKI